MEENNAQVCFLCNKEIIDDKQNVLRGLGTLISISKERKDKHHLFLEKQESVDVHGSCNMRYRLRKRNSVEFRHNDFAIHGSKRFDVLASPTKKKGRRSDSFDFQTNCLFCKTPAPKEQLIMAGRKGIRIEVVKKESFKEKVLKKIQENILMEECKDLLTRISGVDLIAMNARYHDKCLSRFFRLAPIMSKGGRPKDDSIAEGLAKVVQYIEETGYNLYTLDELMKLSGVQRVYLQTLLQNQYGEDNIGFYSKQGTGTVMHFKDAQYEIMKQQWLKESSDCDERENQILNEAAAIIRKHILTFAGNRTTYPPSDRLLDQMDENIPDKLQYFIENIALANKRKDTASTKRKCTAISHSLMALARPRLFLSQLHLGLGVMVFRKFGSRNLVDILYQLGHSVSYSEVINYQNSIMCVPAPKIKKNSFAQFIFDNCDFNTDTIDGNNTFHAMGGILAVTPVDCYESKREIPRKTNGICKEERVEHHLTLKSYEPTNEAAFRNIIAVALDIPNFSNSNIDNADFLWMYSRVKVPKTLGWNGFMGNLTKNMPFERSKIVCLPFVNFSPSHPDTIFTVLSYAVKKAKEMGLYTCFVTFDQPLYQKAAQMIKCSNPDEPISQIKPRLGGFHLLLSYLGGIGFIMGGSGLEELMSICYAAGTSKKMLYGHAYHRAMRAHSLVFSALCARIFQEIEFSSTEEKEIENYLANPNLDYSDVANSEFIRSANDKFIQKMIEIEMRGKTAKLWIQYMRMFQLAKCFLKSEKMGNLVLQLKYIEQMLPYFHASGHYNYARSAHFYVQDMRNYLEDMEKLIGTQTGPEDDARVLEYKNFIENGFNTVRRTEKFFSGTFTDMTIEQDFMRMVKVSGGLINRGINKDASTKFIASLPFMVDICNQMEEFCGVRFNSSDQHVDARDSRVARDSEDLSKLISWIDSHDPFAHNENLVSLATGLVGGQHVNCHEAFEIGRNSILNEIQGKRFGDISFKRKDRVIPLMNAKCLVKVQDEIVTVDPLLIFQRICLTKQSDTDLENHLDYELAPYPMSLFDNGMLRKTAKSSLLKLFSPLSGMEHIDKSKSVHVIDGGMLLHRLPWTKQEKFRKIFERYVKYLKDHFSVEVTVVFDGYEYNHNSIKGAERLRRSTNNSCPDIQFDVDMELPVTKEKFLSNIRNKNRFIEYLKREFENNNISIVQAVDDADLLIVKTALSKYSVNGPPVVVVAEDIDVLVLLTALTPKDRTIYFLKNAKGTKPQQLFSSRSLDERPFIRDNILFLHAISGCDTTSAFYRKGKIPIVENLYKNVSNTRNNELETAIESFKNENLSQEAVFQNGQIVLLSIYNASKDISTLKALRFESFKRLIPKQNAIKLATLPPTAEAARYHFYRAYLQVQYWLSNEMSPEDWGWKRAGDILVPVQTTKEPADPELLKMIFCNCKKECGKRCSCKKAGLQCSSICGSCQSNSCANYKDSPDITLFEDTAEGEGIEDGAGVEISEEVEDEIELGEGELESLECVIDPCEFL